jgi:ankyrin repeat protein/tetratricopeptide (TPR) repeat protein
MVLKCKMCGGDLDVGGEAGVATCQYCGTKQTIPLVNDEKRANLYERANHFRRQSEFDKAIALYETILNDDPKDAEAHWSIVLCAYGVVYVEDPATKKRIPTCSRTLYESVSANGDYRQALALSEGSQRALYEEEARKIEEIQRGILDISGKEEPFDAFICYKETDDANRRTPDSVLANDMYHQLTAEGFKVFFARITLEDMLGSSYEPYIFAALQSSKVMIAIGTKSEYFNATWVKNEWSRYLALIKGGAKKTLIPAYKDMDPYDLPEEFAHLQAQDMGKLGFMQDLIRGIKKIIAPEHGKPNVPEPRAEIGPSEDTLLKRVGQFIEDEDWKSADEYCERILDCNPECARVYIFKVAIDIMNKRIPKQYCRRLENSSAEPGAEEAAFIAKHTLLCCRAFILGGATSRLKYTFAKHPDMLKASVPTDDNPYRSLLSYAVNNVTDTMQQSITTLLECGVDPNSHRMSKSEFGESHVSALNDALQKDENFDIARILLEHGADANTVDNCFFANGETGTKTMLCCATTDAVSPRMVRLLLEHGANPNSTRVFANKYASLEYSALTDAITNAKNVEIVRLLLEHGANPNLVEKVNLSGVAGKKSMLSYAIIYAKSPEMVSLLRKHGAHWKSWVRIDKKTRIEKFYPYDNQQTPLSTAFIKFLRKNGWWGPIFWKSVFLLAFLFVASKVVPAFL